LIENNKIITIKQNNGRVRNKDFGSALWCQWRLCGWSEGCYFGVGSTDHFSALKIYELKKDECVSLYFDSKYPINVNYKNTLPKGVKGYVYKNR
jgi:hypothetical protein